MYNVVDWSCVVWCIRRPYSGPSTGVKLGNVVWDISKRGVLRFRSLKVKKCGLLYYRVDHVHMLSLSALCLLIYLRLHPWENLAKTRALD